MEEELKKVYYDPSTGFISSYGLYLKMERKYPLKAVREWLLKQETYQIHKPARQIRLGHFIAPTFMFSVQADLLDIQNESKYNKNYTFILTIVDIYSRYLWMYPLKTKAMTYLQFKEFLEEYHPKYLTTDNGSEFTSKNFQSILSGVIHRTANPGDHNKLAIVDRLHRTFRERVEHYKTANDTKAWIDVLPQIVSNYNTTYHRTIGMTPEDAKEGDIPKYPSQPTPSHKIKVGDHVRKIIRKGKFTKGAAANWSVNVFSVTKVDKNKISIDDHTKRVYSPYELQVVKATLKPMKLTTTKKGAPALQRKWKIPAKTLLQEREKRARVPNPKYSI